MLWGSLSTQTGKLWLLIYIPTGLHFISRKDCICCFVAWEGMIAMRQFVNPNGQNTAIRISTCLHFILRKECAFVYTTSTQQLALCRWTAWSWTSRKWRPWPCPTNSSWSGRCRTSATTTTTRARTSLAPPWKLGTTTAAARRTSRRRWGDGRRWCGWRRSEVAPWSRRGPTWPVASWSATSSWPRICVRSVLIPIQFKILYCPLQS